MGESESAVERAPHPKKPTLAERRREIEERISTGAVMLSDRARLELDDELDTILEALFTRFRRSWLERTKLETAIEIARILEIKLTLLRNYAVDSTSDGRSLALGLLAIFREADAGTLGLEPIESAWLQGLLSVYAGETLSGLTELEKVFAAEADAGHVELRYHARMMAAHLKHELSEFDEARRHAELAAELATSPNPTAHALAVMGVNSFALDERERAMRELEDALRWFAESEPLFNPYFFRNTLLLCGLICFARRDDEAAEGFCRRAIEHAEPVSYDAFEAWSRLGRVLFRQRRLAEAAEAFEKGITAYRHGESEILLDVCFWLARACLDLERTDRARTLLLRIVTSEVEYSSREDARVLLAGIPSKA